MTAALPECTEASLASSTTAELVQLLIRNEDRVPRIVIDECARRGEEMTEHLGAVLHKDDYWSDDLGVGEWWLRHHAVMILGLIPSESAGRLLVEFLRRINEAEDDDLQDWLLGSWPALFRNKPDAVLQQVRDLAEDRSYDDFTRVEAIMRRLPARHVPAASGRWTRRSTGLRQSPSARMRRSTCVCW